MDSCITSSVRLSSKMARGISHFAPKYPAPTGQGQSRDECLASLREAIILILDYRREESLRALPPDARQELVVIG